MKKITKVITLALTLLLITTACSGPTSILDPPTQEKPTTEPSPEEPMPPPEEPAPPPMEPIPPPEEPAPPPEEPTPPAEVPSYAASAGGVGNENGFGIATLTDGGAIITGLFEGAAPFGSTILNGGPHPAAFVAKLHPDGSWAWATAANGTSINQAWKVTTHNDGSAIIVGRFGGSITFGDTQLVSAGNFDAFAAKVNADGTWAWASHISGPLEVDAQDVTNLSDGGVMITGYFRDSVNFGVTTLVSDGGHNGFVAKINPDGSWAWASKVGGDPYAAALSISALSDDGALVVGTFAGSATFGGDTLRSGRFDNHDAFAARISPSGQWVWATSISGPRVIQARSVSALADNSGIVTGNFADTAYLNGITLLSAGSNDVFVAKVLADGTWDWATQAGGESIDEGYGVSTLADGSSIVVGDYYEAASFGGTTLTTDRYNGFISKLSPSGEWQWTRKIGDSDGVIVRDVGTLPNGRAILIANFRDSVAFGGVTLDSAGSLDIAVIKLTEEGLW